MENFEWDIIWSEIIFFEKAAKVTLASTQLTFREFSVLAIVICCYQTRQERSIQLPSNNTPREKNEDNESFSYSETGLALVQHTDPKYMYRSSQLYF